MSLLPIKASLFEVSGILGLINDVPMDNLSEDTSAIDLPSREVTQTRFGMTGGFCAFTNGKLGGECTLKFLPNSNMGALLLDAGNNQSNGKPILLKMVLGIPSMAYEMIASGGVITECMPALSFGLGSVTNIEIKIVFAKIESNVSTSTLIDTALALTTGQTLFQSISRI